MGEFSGEAIFHEEICIWELREVNFSWRNGAVGNVHIPVQDYKSLFPAVIILASLVNTHTHTDCF